MRVHVVQVAYGDDEPVGERVERVAGLVAEQTTADLVVLPELWAPGGFAYRTWSERAEPVDGPTVRALAASARAIGAPVHVGSIVERYPTSSPDDAGRDPAETPPAAGARGLANTSVVVGADGEILVSYRKIHRFGFGRGEPLLMDAGVDLVTLPLGGTSVGLATCYDLRFPELFRSLLDGGSEVFIVPAAWPAARVEHWRLLGRARAVENQAFVVQANTAGTHARTAMGGHSQIVSPTGDVLAEAGQGEEVIVADLDLAGLRDYRASFPVLADRRLT